MKLVAVKARLVIPDEASFSALLILHPKSAPMELLLPAGNVEHLALDL